MLQKSKRKLFGVILSVDIFIRPCQLPLNEIEHNVKIKNVV